ncbi:MAG: hypothetical protein QXO47_03560 [Thermoproteota archaeon]|nr:hypothetical protein [Candidatus Brockarchaeota archaeon]
MENLERKRKINQLSPSEKAMRMEFIAALESLASGSAAACTPGTCGTGNCEAGYCVSGRVIT